MSQAIDRYRSSYDSNSKMDRAVLVKLHLVLERLRSHHGNMEHLTNSLLVGLEDLGEENARLSGQLTEEDAKIALMIGEPSFYHMASIEAREKFDGALRVNNELRAELQEFKTFNAQLGRQYDEARGSVIKLNIQLEVAQNEINRLNHQVQEAQRELKGPRTQATKLHQVPTDGETQGPLPLSSADILVQLRSIIPSCGHFLPVLPSMETHFLHRR